MGAPAKYQTAEQRKAAQTERRRQSRLKITEENRELSKHPNPTAVLSRGPQRAQFLKEVREKLVPLIETPRKWSELGAELGGAEEDLDSEQGTRHLYHSPIVESRDVDSEERNNEVSNNIINDQVRSGIQFVCRIQLIKAASGIVKQELGDTPSGPSSPTYRVIASSGREIIVLDEG